MAASQKFPGMEAYNDLRSKLNRISSFLSRYFRNLINYEETEDGLEYKFTYNRKSVVVTLEPSHKNKLNMTFKVDDSVKAQYKDIDDEKNNIDEYLLKGFKEVFGEDFDASKIKMIKNSKQMQVTLKKIIAADSKSIDLVAVNSNYDASQSFLDLTALVNDDTFADTVGEVPTTYLIEDMGDEFDIQSLDTPMIEADTKFTYTQLLSSAYSALFDFQSVHWNAVGENFYELHETSEMYYREMLDVVDTLAELCVEYTDGVPHPMILMQNPMYEPDYSFSSSTGFTRETGYAQLNFAIGKFVNAMEFYYCNFDHDVQSMLDEWIRYWRKESNYKLQRYFKK